MKSTQLNKLITTLSAIALLSLGTNALAQPGLDRLTDELELTDEQREQLTTLRDEQREETQALAKQRREASAEQREAARVEAEERQAAQQQRMSEILTPEQMAQLEEMRTAAQEQRLARADRMQNMGPRGGDMRNQRGEGRPMQGPGARPGRSAE